jgi:hypothetical protein
MGLLTVGHPLSWEESKKHHAYVKEHGIEQFIYLYRRNAEKSGAILRWGDEVEYFVCHLDEGSKVAKLPLRAPEILDKLAKFRESLALSNECAKCAKGIIWHPEYANWYTLSSLWIDQLRIISSFLSRKGIILLGLCAGCWKQLLDNHMAKIPRTCWTSKRT